MVKMKYIIMCGGEYKQWEIPRQLTELFGETLVERTIRLLRENGVEDIAISSNSELFERFGVPVLKHKNDYVVGEDNRIKGGQWFDAFYPTDEPTCYIFGDVVFSPQAIKKIVETETDDIELFGSKKPFADNYMKEHEEPFALKVMKPKHLKEAIEEARRLDEEHKFWRKPLVWELFTVIKKAPLQVKRDEYTTDYVGISDYSCDIDRVEDIKKIKKVLGDVEMIRCEVIEPFTLERFNELKDIEWKGVETPGRLNVGDKFLCEKELADYLNGGNSKQKVVVKIIEVIPPKETITVKNITLGDGNIKNSSYTVTAKKTVKKSKSKR